MVSEPSLIFVCDSKIGSSTLRAMAATSPFRMSPYSYFPKYSFMVFAMCSLKADWWVPPCVVCCPLTKESYSSPFWLVWVKAISMSSPFMCTMG